MDKEIEYIKEQRENFLKICNKEFKQNEYYNIIMNIDYDDYDNIIMTQRRYLGQGLSHALRPHEFGCYLFTSACFFAYALVP